MWRYYLPKRFTNAGPYNQFQYIEYLVVVQVKPLLSSE